MRIAKRYQDNLDRIKGNIKTSWEYFKPNYDRYHMFRKFIFQTALNETDIAVLSALGKPQVEFNVLEAYISRLCGEFSKQEPSIKVSASDGKPINPQMLSLVEMHMRAILQAANNNSFENEVYKDLLSGGFSTVKVYTKYANEMSFDQIICVARCFDPTLCGFDINANLPHKGDGHYCFENYPKTIDEFKDEYGGVDINGLKFSRDIGGFSWSYRTDTDDIVLLSDYYEKKKRETKIVQLANGQTMKAEDYEQFLEKWKNSGQISQPPAASKSRNSFETVICRYTLIENQVIDYKETDYKWLPIVFVDGNSIMLRETSNTAVQQITRPYVYHARDQQRLINLAGQTLANDIENMVQHKWKVAKESIPPEYANAYKNNQLPSVVVYNAFDVESPDKPLPPPQEVVRTPEPPEIMNTFSSGAQMIQAILGSYDASLGINNNQLSGVAIVEGATQSNAAAMPYVMGFLQGLNQVAQIVLDLIPKYYVTPRSIPVMMPDGKKSHVPINQPNGISMAYDPNALDVNVEAGVNFAIQKSRALQQIIGLSQASPLFSQFINQEGLEILIDNLEIRGGDQLKVAAKQFMQKMQHQQQMQSQQPNPIQLKMQMEQQKLMAQAQQNQTENQLRAAEIANDSQENDNDRMKIMLEARQAGVNDAVQMQKARAETYSKAIDLALKSGDQTHRHAKESIELTHNILNTQRQNDMQQQSMEQTNG